MNKGPPLVHHDDDDDCCLKTRRQGVHQSTNEALFHKLEVIIRARYVQLGAYSHDEHEHLLQAKYLLQQGHDTQARLEVQLALQKRALHKRESLKYHNLVSLRDTLQEAHRNLSMAQIMQEGSGILSKADLRALAPPQERQGTSTPLLVTMASEEEEEEEPETPTVTETEVETQLALLRLPPTPSSEPPLRIKERALTTL